MMEDLQGVLKKYHGQIAFVLFLILILLILGVW